MINGVINVYKEPGYTSHDVVARLRGITHQKKIGHTGTLDPAAVGVLCVCLGSATHICDMLTNQTKEYEAVLLLGISTDTQDTTGTVLETRDINVTEEQFRRVVSHYYGEIEQIPPMYSALKVNGKKLYELARAGIEVERKARKVNIYSIEIVDITLPRATIRVTCSKGTYIRTLINDIGNELGCGATMEHLTRTRVGNYDINGAHTLDEIEQIVRADELDSILITPQEVFSDLKTFVTCNSNADKRAGNGNILELQDISGEMKSDICDGEEVKLVSEGGFFYGIYRFDSISGILKPVQMFLC